jgi:hypothetical protein
MAGSLGATGSGTRMFTGYSAIELSELARNWAQVFAFLGALAAGVFALFRYWRSEQTQQTEQVREFFRMFFESDRHKHIRFVLENPANPEFDKLRRDVLDDGAPRELEEKFIDYLNFFEFVVGLMHRRMVARREVEWMFQHFIDRLFAIDWVRDYIAEWGFEELMIECRRSLGRRRRQAG